MNTRNISKNLRKKDYLNYPMIKWAKDLFPICRSITGEGIRKTFKYFKKINNEFKVIKFRSGTKVFDWTIPKEWNIKDAYIEHQSKKRFAEFKKNNLHVVGYSYPIKKKISKKELFKKIYTQQNLPKAIPYITSYYKKDWGFCLSENEKKMMPKGNYKVVIDSSLKTGNLDLIHSVFKGKSKKEIFFSSYACHPSMANNELSGPVLLNAIMKYIKLNYPKKRYSYRFVILPETIGSIAYLSKFRRVMKKNIICGFNLSCVGDDRAYSMIHTPDEKSLADEALESILLGKKNFKKYSFLDRGSDERQYCSPGIELPVCGFSRSINYPEYHTSLDNFKVVTEKGLQGSFEVFKNIIDALEMGLYPKSNILCEPNLGKRNLWPNLSKRENYTEDYMLRLNLIAYANGKNNIFKISKLLNLNLSTVLQEYLLLKKEKILK